MRAIDLFAGDGGFSEAARMAGVDVVWAANHWAKAVRVHGMNHPAVKRQRLDGAECATADRNDHNTRPMGTGEGTRDADADGD